MQGYNGLIKSHAAAELTFSEYVSARPAILIQYVRDLPASVAAASMWWHLKGEPPPSPRHLKLLGYVRA